MCLGRQQLGAYHTLGASQQAGLRAHIILFDGDFAALLAQMMIKPDRMRSVHASVRLADNADYPGYQPPKTALLS